MIKLIMCLFFVTFMLSAGYGREVVSDSLLQALIQVESGGNDSAIGDGGKAVGCLQIWPITIIDANRIIGKNKYTLQDRFNRKKSIEICRIILGHYECGNEAQSRRWNGGGHWRQNKNTIKYWNKVKKELDKYR